jgi:deoxyribonuclease IV
MHMGSHKQTSEKEGLERLSAALNKVVDKTRAAKVALLLENTAGGGSSLGYDFRHQKEIFGNLADLERFGLALDTAHAFAAGYDLRGPSGLEKVLDEIDAACGLDKLRLVHLNDSSVKLGSRVDRHQHIGKGYIGLEGVSKIVNHPRLKEKPFILETPKDTLKSDALNLKTVRKLRD